MSVDDQELNDRLIHFLRKFMYQNRWSQTKLAHDMGRTQSMLSQVFRGKRKISNAFQQSIKYYLIEKGALEDPYEEMTK